MDTEQFTQRLAVVRDIRARHPELLRNRHASRHRRTMLGRGGRVLLIEADDPARGARGAGAAQQALVDRPELLLRLSSALAEPGVDGVIAASDVIDDLVLLDALDERIAIGSLTPGLDSAHHAYDSAATGFDAAVVAVSHLDGGRLAVPVTPQDPSGARDLERAAREIDVLAANGVVALVEPSLWLGADEDARRDQSTEGLTRAIEIVSGLGSRSSYLWLVLPAVDDLGALVRASTLPVLVRAHDTFPLEHPHRWDEIMRLPGVRGAILPVGALYPVAGDMLDALRAMARLVHADDEGSHP